MDILTTAALVLIGFWLLGFVLKLGGGLIHLLLLLGLAALAAKYFNLIQF